MVNILAAALKVSPVKYDPAKYPTTPPTRGAGGNTPVNEAPIAVPTANPTDFPIMDPIAFPIVPEISTTSLPVS
ncbi:MAG: hypothetical protein OEZ35_07100, partial [Candidatus Bathyarchaeota archaeon]|nr:hypothetical protein [Candidatus Bathyarchaeota archaeon]